jgi:hypothetical protein
MNNEEIELIKWILRGAAPYFFVLFGINYTIRTIVNVIGAFKGKDKETE